MTENAKGLPFKSDFEKNWFRTLLKETPITISFVKKDGTERKMICTLSEKEIPQEKMPKNTGKAQSDEAQAVFDLEKQEWRSFRWDSMKKFEFTLGND
jgi:hypothetical protein